MREKKKIREEKRKKLEKRDWKKIMSDQIDSDFYDSIN